MSELKHSVKVADGKHPYCIPSGRQSIPSNHKMEAYYHKIQKGGHRWLLSMAACVHVSKKALYLITLEGSPFQLKHGGQRRRHERERGWMEEEDSVNKIKVKSKSQRGQTGTNKLLYVLCMLYKRCKTYQTSVWIPGVRCHITCKVIYFTTALLFTAS